MSCCCAAYGLSLPMRSLRSALSHINAAMVALYAYFLFYATFSSSPSVCIAFQKLDPQHDCMRPSEMRDTEDCSLNLSTVLPVLDRYVVAHLAGWLVKAVLVPDRKILWIASILFEITEAVFSNLVPTLRECWWDTLILDVLLCNAAGIELGIALSTRLRGIVLPIDFAYAVSSEDDPHKSEKNGLQAAISVMIVWSDLNAFLLKHVLWVRSASDLNIYRLIFMCALSIPALQQLYKQASSQSSAAADSISYVIVYVALLHLEVMAYLWRSIHNLANP